MKQMFKKVIIPTIALSLVFMLPARAVEPSLSASTQQQAALPSEIAFQIPMNTYCSSENSLDFSFQLSNALSTTSDLTLYLYGQDGSSFNEEGSSYREIQSSIVPGKAFQLKANATGTYHINFGNHKKCSERLYMGKIVANSGQASVLARGWVEVNGRFEDVTVNGNNKVDLAVAAPAASAAPKAPTAEPAAASAVETTLQP
ncbi:hypothetical protein GC093_15030 [Paenibacillus sp. LMG 31456]|uniref:Uncharacterized protein n=1 Tax=Paenibacillus foliorum TaxID=2654974 RepID=A0A972K0C5_9BACL|nr:hypothetical protein [Paenibacillus foliorum]NOU94521.1 hypothetical protein [Paenibacillus foliorum]